MIAIHGKTGQFAPGWISYCESHGIPFTLVDCFSSEILQSLQGCDALLWHWRHYDYSAALFARQLIASVEAMGLQVFPNLSTCWHYDDKLGQKYLLEAVDAPIVPSHVFYDERSALSWLESADFPVIWKLRGGAGSQNVEMVHSLSQARGIVSRSFGRGWRPSRHYAFRERIRGFRRGPGLRSLLDVGRGAARSIVPHKAHRRQPTERDYAYFQEFVRGNDHDIRVIVIGGRAFGIKRMVRAGDFRASGSGHIVYEREQIPEACIQIAFDVTRAIGSQCCAFDFVLSDTGWLIIEISYAFSLPGYLPCPGYWTDDLRWHKGEFKPEFFMIEDVLKQIAGAG